MDKSYDEPMQLDIKRQVNFNQTIDDATMLRSPLMARDTTPRDLTPKKGRDVTPRNDIS